MDHRVPHILLALLLVCSLAACAGPVNLPVVTPDAGQLSYPGKFVWFDLYAPDIDAVAQFYDRVFGWSVERADPDSSKVKTILQQNRRIGSIFLIGPDSAAPTAEPGWVACLSVGDVDAAFAQAIKAGATSISPPAEHPFRGRMAEILDPQGARVRLLTSSTGDPRDQAPEDGMFLGAELWTPDPAAAKFYASLAGYKSVVLELQTGPYVMLLTRNRPRGGVTAPLADVPGPVWIPQVAVRDAVAVLRRVETYGGTVLLRPDPEDKTGRVGVFVDPAGGVIGVREFTPVEN